MRTHDRFAAFRRSVPFLALLVLAACGGGEPAAEAPTGESEADLVARARGIHERVITLDTHDDINPANFTAERNYTMELGTQVDIPKMEAGGLDVSWMIVYVGQGELTDAGFDDAYAQAIEKFDAIHRLCDELAPERIELAPDLAPTPARSPPPASKVAMIGIENAYPRSDIDLGRTSERFARARRALHVAGSHQGHSQFCDSNTGERDDVWLHGGLSELGRAAVIVEMNRVGHDDRPLPPVEGCQHADDGAHAARR